MGPMSPDTELRLYEPIWDLMNHVAHMSPYGPDWPIKTHMGSMSPYGPDEPRYRVEPI